MLIYSGTENFVSALCASIPVLRPLWTQLVHGYISRDGSYPSKRGYKLSDLRSGDNPSGSGGGISGGPAGMGPETRIYAREFQDASDNNSQDSILGVAESGQKGDGNRIHCQTEFSLNSSAPDTEVPLQPDEREGKR